MTDDELQQIVDALAPIIREHVSSVVLKQMEPVTARLFAAEQRQAVPGRDGRDGVSIPGERGEKGERGERGESGGIGPRGDSGPPGQRGEQGDKGDKGADAVVDYALINAEIARLVSLIPVPKDGINGRDGVDGKDGAAGEPGINGKDGADGLHGKDGLNGRDGVNGKDGLILTAEDFVGYEYDGERTATMRFGKGDTPFSMRFPVPIYREVWTEGRTYEAHDIVTWSGSLWIATTATSAKPDLPTPESRAWRLCVKRGRDGKAGVKGDPGDRGPKGDQGDRGPKGY